MGRAQLQLKRRLCTTLCGECKMSASSTFPKHSKAPAPHPAGATTTTQPVVLPTVNLPVLSPGHPLAHSTAVLEASTSRYFQPGKSSHGKRTRSAADVEASAVPPNVLDILCVEEDAQALQRTASGNGRDDTGAVAAAARTKAYLTKLFQEPARCEQDVFRLVDVAHCRRVLREEEETIVKGEVAASSDTAEELRVSAFNSCLTVGQHRRYRAVVMEWLRHQPSRSAPPDSGEVLKVVQWEQRLFAAVLRREAQSRLHANSLYELLTPVLVRYAKTWRIDRMRRQLLSFLGDAKRHEGALLLCCCPSPPSSTSNPHTEAEAGYSGVTFEQQEEEVDGDGGDNSTHAAFHKLTPLQLYQRRYPSLRVLQWHMAKFYNAQQTGTAAPFPNPQVQATIVRFTVRGDAAVASSPVCASPIESAVPELRRHLPARLLQLSALPQSSTNSGDDGSDSNEEGGQKDEDEEEGNEKTNTEDDTASFAAHHVPYDPSTSIPVASLRSYVEQHLLPRFGWRPSKHEVNVEDVHEAVAYEEVVDSVSLSMTFAAALKLFVAHVDTEEPRTSFRLPVRVHLTKPTASQAGEEATAPYFHAHVMVGDAVPNVKESRHSVQVAAAEFLLRQQWQRQQQQHLQRCGDAKGGVGMGVGVGGREEDHAHAHEEEATHRNRHFRTGGAAPVDTDDDAKDTSVSCCLAQLSVARVHLTRNAVAQNAAAQGRAAVQAAGGDRIKASAAVLLAVKEAVADAAPPLPFHVSAQPHTGSGEAPTAAALDFLLAKMERLNATSAGTPAPVPNTATSAAAAVAADDLLDETAGRCTYLLELLSPREMLQLDLIFACYPGATARIHRVQLTAPSEAEDGGEEVGCMHVLAVETLTRERWARLRQRLQCRPPESLTTSPTPAEVLAVQSWDLFYDTLAWLLDGIVHRAADALRTLRTSDDDASRERFLYFVLSNHANLVNTCASSKLHTKQPRHADGVVENVAPSFTESRFAVWYVLQDASELYPNYEPRIDITFEAENLTFLEETEEEDTGGEENSGDEKARALAATRLYRDPHTWNGDGIPFTFRRRPV